MLLLLDNSSYIEFLTEIAFTTDPFETPVWETVTPIATSASMGRRTERDHPETGRSTTRFDNSGRDYDPTNTAGPYYPNVLPERRIRCRVTNGVDTWGIFHHFIEGWPQPWETPAYSESPVPATDGFEILAQAQLPDGTSFPEQLSGARIEAILDSVGWPAADRDIDTGQSDVQAAAAGTLDGTDALSLIFAVADTELGIPFVDGDGIFVFHDRHRRLLDPYTTSQATFSDDPATGEFLYAKLAASYDRREIANDWRVTRTGGTLQQAEDSTSIDTYRRRTRTRSTLQTSDSEALDLARFLVSRYKEPALRFTELTIEPLENQLLWEQALTRQLGDRITVIRHPAGGGDPIQQDVHIEAIRREIVPMSLGTSRITWQLSPAAHNNYWTMAHAELSLIGESTVMPY